MECESLNTACADRSRVRRLCPQLICLALSLWLLGEAACIAGTGVYRFTDSRGVVHFSNVPIDNRFEAIDLRPKATGYSKRAKEKVPDHRGYDRLIRHQAKLHRLDPALVKAVIAAESNFSPFAVSHAGAEGLMQLMPKTARGMGVKDSFKPVENVGGGSRYLREMLDRYGDLRRALAAYNAGPKAVDRHRGIPPYPETEAYVARVLAYYRGYRGDFHR